VNFHNVPNLRQDLLAAKYCWQQTFNFIEGLRIGKATRSQNVRERNCDLDV